MLLEQAVNHLWFDCHVLNLTIGHGSLGLGIHNIAADNHPSMDHRICEEYLHTGL
jgi:hypothetical protein